MSSLAIAARLRTAGLILVGAMALHWLRYLLAYGGAAQGQLDHQGHGYLSEGIPFVAAAAVAFVLSAALLRVCSARRAEAGEGGIPAAALYVAALLGVYSAQELTEGLLAEGHASGAAALFADHGWIALPLAGVLGWLLARLQSVLLHTELFLAGVLAGRDSIRPRAPLAISPGVRPCLAPAASGLLAFGLARRPPPQPLVV